MVNAPSTTTSTKHGLCEHCNQPLEPGRERAKPEFPKQVMKDNTRFCGWCRMHFNCCQQGLHGEVGAGK